MHQAAVMISNPLWVAHSEDKTSDITEARLKGAHDAVAMELGLDYLSERFWFTEYVINGNKHNNTHTRTYTVVCKNFLNKHPAEGADVDVWIKNRLSLIEIAFQRRRLEIQLVSRRSDYDGFVQSEDGQVLGCDEELNGAGDARVLFDQGQLVERLDHLVD